MNFNFSCIGSRISLDLPHQIWEAQSYDPPGQIWVTRLFHNKIAFLANNYSRCYLSYFSPEFLTAAFSILGLILFLIGVYFLISRRNRWFLAVLLAAPLPALFEFPTFVPLRAVIIYGVELLVMGYGIVSLVKMRKK